MLTNYLKLAVRVLLRRKFFTLISLVGISLTLVVLMVATAMLDNLFAPRAPESRLDRTLCVYVIGQYGPEGAMTTEPGYKFLDRYVRTLPDVEKTAIFSQPQGSAAYLGGRKIDLYLKHTDGGYWQILNFHFLEGGPFTESDEAHASFVAVINEATRTKVFGGQPALGKSLEVDGQRFRVVGVVPNVPFSRFAPFSDVWVPISTNKTDSYKRNLFGEYNGMVLARSRADFARLKDEFQARLKTVPLEDPKRFDTVRGGLDTFFEAICRLFLDNTQSSSGGAGIIRSILLIAALLFMTLPTLNLVSINLSRIMERASEIGVRKAFGASSATLVGQFVVENVVLTMIGGLLGFALSAAVLAALNRAEVIPYAHFDLNLRIFGYGLLLAVFFGVFSGVYPAWKMSRMHPVNALRGGSL
jgi:putative ABC transport system permease protein